MSKVYEKKGLFIGIVGAVGRILSYLSLFSSDWMYDKDNCGNALMKSHSSMSSIMQVPACRTLTVPRWVVLGWMMYPEVGLTPQVSFSCWISCSVIVLI